MSRSFRRNFSSFFDNFQSHSRSHFQKIFIESNFKFLKIIFKFLFQILSNFINFLKIIMNPLLYFSSKKKKKISIFRYIFFLYQIERPQDENPPCQGHTGKYSSKQNHIGSKWSIVFHIYCHYVAGNCSRRSQHN